MTDDPIRHLLDEHRLILAEFDHLTLAVERLEAEGEAAVAGALPVLERTGRMMAGQLDRHRRKEDDVLFPAVEKVVGPDSPTGVMREEHQAIHAHGRQLRETLRELNEVEHPLIEANAERLRQLTAAGGGAESLAATGREILRLIQLHFDKEEQILFPMAYDLLSPADLATVAAGMQAIDAEAA